MALERFVSKQGYKKNSPDKNRPFNLVPSGDITMQGVEHPVFGQDNRGNQQMMYPGYNYHFPGDIVMEVPVKQQGGEAPDLPNPYTVINPQEEVPEGNTPFYATKRDYNSMLSRSRGWGYRGDPSAFPQPKDFKFIEATLPVHQPNASTQFKTYPPNSEENIAKMIATESEKYQQYLNQLEAANTQGLQQGGSMMNDYVDVELSKQEVQELKNKGFRVEEL